jgi:hypothetical protein
MDDDEAGRHGTATQPPEMVTKDRGWFPLIFFRARLAFSFSSLSTMGNNKEKKSPSTFYHLHLPILSTMYCTHMCCHRHGYLSIFNPTCPMLEELKRG